MSSASTITPVSAKKARWKKITAAILTGVFALWVAFVTFMWHAMHRPPEDFARVMSHMPWEVFLVVPFETLWTRARAGSLNLGDSAPDFSLVKLYMTAGVHLSEIHTAHSAPMTFSS